ncbi:flagellar hook-associated protein FlgL [Domibacillus sp. A3M-37]|uniref:flagellar hook-associated protein FlgL n=1 Tax=Domibacillus sp. A3M-37 TaxID=2962037 RepID=UPI0020B8F8DC|nr:flagellar hook-associated protein FlgL [Domibacillus sp. A3M-37]MCP3761234.1 flagellar hook-associated protein FlgL [Domibacillus sp. A3M-37]
MRVTQSMLSSNMMKNLTSSLSRLDKLNTQVATQKKITKPSDDPVVAMKGIVYRRSLQEVEQFQRNFSEAYNWVENTDSSLDKAKLAMDRIRELVVQTSNDTYDAEQREATKAEVVQLKEHLLEIANTKFGEKYLFNGTATTTKPVEGTATGATVSSNAGKAELELSKGVHIQVNITAAEAFPAGLFEDVQKIIDTLEDDTTTGADLSGLLEDLDVHMENNSTARAKIGARFNRIELMEARAAEQRVVASRILSENEDVDFEQVVTDLTVQETVHKAALSVGARIIQPSLMDYLR